MAVVGSRCDFRELLSPSSGKFGSYLPAIPPNPPKRATQYTRSVAAAPHSALSRLHTADIGLPISVSLLHPDTRFRVRKQVGLTNRWRAADPVGADLLGNGQAVRASLSTYNRTLMRIMTAEGPRSSSSQSEIDSVKQSKKCRRRCMSAGQVKCHPVLQLTEVHPSQFDAEGELSRQFVAKILAVFDDVSRGYGAAKEPDVVLDCAGIQWKLHLPHVNKSEVLTELMAQNKTYRQCPAHGIGPPHTQSNNYQKPVDETVKYTQSVDDDVRLHACWHAKTGRGMVACPYVTVGIDDSIVTPYALAVVLGNLYRGEFQLPTTNVHAFLLAAYSLRFNELQKVCVDVMMDNINCATVAFYHSAAAKCKEQHLQLKCERWLELFLVNELADTVQLKYLSQQALLRTLLSSRLFTYNEFALLQAVLFWIFLQFNPTTQRLPPYSTILTYFASSSKAGPLLDHEDGCVYTELFRALHLHGITDNVHMRDIQMMNILPQQWLVKLLSGHYNAVNTGGDMSLMTNFSQTAIRHGFIMESEVVEKSEVISLFGFHFELRAEQDTKFRDSYRFHIQRLKPLDPVLSMHDSERQTFSMRPERVIQYSITVQSLNNYQDSGMMVHRFGLGVKTSASKIVSWQNLTPPLCVTYSMLLPPS